MLLAEHLGAYADLASEELLLMSMALKRRWMWQLFGSICLSIAVVLAGVSILIWASQTLLPAGAMWWLILTPLIPAATGVWAYWMGSKPLQVAPFAQLRQQMLQDSALLKRYTR
jgi:hypothetical protein